MFPIKLNFPQLWLEESEQICNYIWFVFVLDKFDLHSRRWLQLKETLQAHSRQDF